MDNLALADVTRTAFVFLSQKYALRSFMFHESCFACTVLVSHRQRNSKTALFRTQFKCKSFFVRQQAIHCLYQLKKNFATGTLVKRPDRQKK